MSDRDEWLQALQGFKSYSLQDVLSRQQMKRRPTVAREESDRLLLHAVSRENWNPLREPSSHIAFTVSNP